MLLIPSQPAISGPESLGYATPTAAAIIGLDGLYGRENWCEWIYSCYGRDAREALKRSIQHRHGHKGYMAEYKLAKNLVDIAIKEEREPLFASWF
jgi:hypothetical protein